MSAQVILTSTKLPEGYCPNNEQERLDSTASHLIGELPGNFSPWNFGPNEPDVNDRNLPWFRTRTSPSGSPSGAYSFVNGQWVMENPHAPGEIVMWMGDAAGIDTLWGGAAGAVSDATGPMWEIITELQARFPVGVGTLPSGTALAVGATGGEESVVLTLAQLAAHKHQMYADVTVGVQRTVNETSYVARARNDGSSDADYSMVRIADDDTTKPTVGPSQEVGGGNGHTNMPPYMALHFVRRTNRIYFVAS